MLQRRTDAKATHNYKNIFLENNLCVLKYARVQLYIFLSSPLFHCVSRILAVLRIFLCSTRCNASAVSYNERTALIILLFSNESVDADGSVPARKMHGTGCICEFLLRRPSIFPSPRFGEQKKELFRHNERDSRGFCRITRSQYIICQKPGWEKRLYPSHMIVMKNELCLSTRNIRSGEKVAYQVARFLLLWSSGLW